MRKEEIEAHSNIKQRMEKNYAMHYCNELDDYSSVRKSKATRRKILQKNTYLSTFAESNTYERFLILQTFVARKTYLSDSLDVIIQKELERIVDELVLCAIKKRIDEKVDRRIERLSKPMVESEMEDFLKKMNIGEISTIVQMIEQDLDTRHTNGEFNTISQYIIYRKLKTLSIVMSEYVRAKFEINQSAGN